MIIRTKKRKPYGVVKMLTGGNIKEIIIKEDILNPEQTSIELCFKGEFSSGIVELKKGELEEINKKVFDKLDLVKSSKVIKFKK
jgi:hypothetical protein